MGSAAVACVPWSTRTRQKTWSASEKFWSIRALAMNSVPGNAGVAWYCPMQLPTIATPQLPPSPGPKALTLYPGADWYRLKSREYSGTALGSFAARFAKVAFMKFGLGAKTGVLAGTM